MEGDKPDRANLRLFAAIDVPRGIIEAIEPVRLAFAETGLRTVDPERIHLTLVFFGSVSSDRLASLGGAMREAAVPMRSEVSASGAGVFPGAGRTRVGWIGILDLSASLQTLQDSLATKCQAFMHDPEDRAYSPHLTLGRARRDQRPDERKIRKILERWRNADFGRWEPREVVLYSSEAEGGGRRYRALERFPIR